MFSILPPGQELMGAFSTAFGRLDILVFADGIEKNAPIIRVDKNQIILRSVLRVKPTCLSGRFLEYVRLSDEGITT